MFAHINNCIRARKCIVYIPYTKYKLNLILAIKECGFFQKVSLLKHNIYRSDILIELKYISGVPLMQDIIQISKPSKRVYWGIKQLKFKYQLGIYVLSTDRGIRTSLQEPCFGGEPICKLI